MHNLNWHNDKPSYSDVVTLPRFLQMQNQSMLQNYRPSSTNSDDSSGDEMDQPSVSFLVSKTLRVDRCKLERMIETPGTIPELNSAEEFFNNVIRATETTIQWPRNLKTGKKTRKDLRVRITGRDTNNIAWAQGIITASLAPEERNIQMKILISENDHSYIIGRTGNNIKRIMEETSTNIHFPDSNYGGEWNNRVSIYGTLENVLKARDTLHLSGSLTMCFELPYGIPLPRNDLPNIKTVETEYDVKVTFMPVPNKASYFTIVKGSEEMKDQLMEAVRLLVYAICGAGSVFTLANIRLDIPKILFDLSNEDGATNIASIEEKYDTRIIIPRASGSMQKVTIVGSIQDIYSAREEILANLPVDLTFDIDTDFDQKSSWDIERLAIKYGISVSMREKISRIVVTLRGAEKNIPQLIEAYQEATEKENSPGNGAVFPKAYMLSDPDFRNNLENYQISDNHFEEITKNIWAPLEPSNSLYVQPFRSLYSHLQENIDVLDQGESASESASLSSGTSCSSNETISQGERSSEDWSVMDPIIHNDNQHFECDFSSADMEVAFILMSSTHNCTSIFRNPIGAERLH